MSLVESLVSRLPKHHPEADKMRVAIVECLAAAEKFEAKRRELDAKGHLTPRGRHEALKEQLVKESARDLRDAAKPISEALERLRTMKAAIKARPSTDPHDVVAELKRQELRTTIANLTDDERIPFVLSSKDPRVAEAVLDVPAIVSALPEEVVAKIESAYQERVFGKDLEEIKAFEAVVAEAQSAAAVARDEMQRTIGLERKAFDEIVTPIETKARALAAARR